MRNIKSQPPTLRIVNPVSRFNNRQLSVESGIRGEMGLKMRLIEAKLKRLDQIPEERKSALDAARNTISRINATEKELAISNFMLDIVLMFLR